MCAVGFYYTVSLQCVCKGERDIYVCMKERKRCMYLLRERCVCTVCVCDRCPLQRVCVCVCVYVCVCEREL